ncbi:hypothetical protein ACE1B6_16075 [Aerosakkonemataceae cyanobacterium BLCC-F154]|uniref:Uncharacterized protein n=1 Tax=Floridaenema fluviatile BLCC-F154 TaxID=3153640 RepID=A0ABV4YD62_9CYAN
MPKEPMNLTIETSLKRRVKAQAALLGRTVSDVVAELLEQWLKEVESQTDNNEK